MAASTLLQSFIEFIPRSLLMFREGRCRECANVGSSRLEWRCMGDRGAYVSVAPYAGPCD